MSAKRLEAILDALQDISSLAFGSFMIIHLSAPISAFVSGGEPTASRIQLLGRVWYQDSSIRELLVVWGSLGTHILVGVVKRITRVHRMRKIRDELERSAQQSEHGAGGFMVTRKRVASRPNLRQRLRAYKPETWHAWSSYLMMPFLLDHILIHRLRPTTPISYLFISHYLQSRPLFSQVKYYALVSFATFHTLVGLDRLGTKYLRNQSRTRRLIRDSEQSWTIRLSWLGVVGAVGLGMRRISREPVPNWLARRFEVVLV